MEIIVAIFMGVALSATAGFRVFTPLFATSIVSRAGWTSLTEGFEWLSSKPTIIAFGVAAIIEILSNYIPIISSFLKVLVTPLAICAGVLLTAAFIGEIPPPLKWSVSIVVGGGVAGFTHTIVTIIKAAAATFTAGVITPVASLIEDAIAVVIPFLVFILPILSVILVIGLIIFTVKRGRKLFSKESVPV